MLHPLAVASQVFINQVLIRCLLYLFVPALVGPWMICGYLSGFKMCGPARCPNFQGWDKRSSEEAVSRIQLNKGSELFLCA